MPFFIVLAGLGSACCFAVSLYSFFRCILIFLDREETLAGIAYFSVSIGLVILGILLMTAVNDTEEKHPKTRDIHLTVPVDSSVNAQITSGDDVIELQNL